jgi:hypothetical protein
MSTHALQRNHISWVDLKTDKGEVGGSSPPRPTIQICFDDFVGAFAMLGRIASQGAYLELIACSKSPYYSASLLPRCADYRDELLVSSSHM